MWKEGEHYGRISLDLNPHNIDAMRVMLATSLNGRGDIKEARHFLQTFPPDASLIGDAVHSTTEGLIGWRAYIFLLEGNYPAALRIFEPDSRINDRLRLSARATIHVLIGDAAKTREESEEARRLVEARLSEHPNELDGLIQLSWIHLALDNKSEAVTFAQKAADVMPLEKDALAGAHTLYNLAVIKARTGNSTEAIAILKRLLAMPAGHEVTIATLKMSPYLYPIRNDAEFQQLLTMKEHVGP
jgi:tetratricopeptide (TPR) repeat protein